MDDILRIYYEEELTGKDIKNIFKPFASIQNRILIDYKKFRDHLMAKTKPVAGARKESSVGAAAATSHKV